MLDISQIPSKSNSAFSLIELIVAMTLIAILAWVGISSYEHHLTKVKRLEAKVALLHLASVLEENYAVHQSYVLESSEEIASLSTLAEPYYRLEIIQATSSHFMIAASPLGIQAKNDSACGQLILNDQGQKKISGTASYQECW